MQRCPSCNSFFDDSITECPYDQSKLAAVAIGGQQQPTNLLGQTLGDRFKIQTVIGEGGMGKVYKGIDLTTNSPVAIKVLHREISGDERSVKRFMGEARLLQSLSHPNIIKLFAFGQSTAGALYIAMEFLEGSPADILIKDNAISRLDAVKILDQVCAALSEAHLQGIVHRDLKPANIFVNHKADGEIFVTVLDFGIAKVAGGQSLTVTGKVMGTPSYMAPEQIAGKEPNPRVDIYALGILAYELIAGRPPFQADMPIELLYLHLHEPPPPISTLCPQHPVSKAFSDVLLNFLEKDPDDRPKNVVEVRNLLRPFIDNPALLEGELTDDNRKTAALDVASMKLGKRPDAAAPPDAKDPGAFATRKFAPVPGAAGKTPAAAPQRKLWPWILLLVVALFVAVGLAVAVFVVLTNARSRTSSLETRERPAVVALHTPADALHALAHTPARG